MSCADPSLYLLDQIDRRLQIHAEIDEGPRDTLAFILLLLKHEHVVIEVLLQLLVREIDAQLLETVVLRSGSCTTMHTGTQAKGEIAREREIEKEKTEKKTCRVHRSRPVGRSFD